VLPPLVTGLSWWIGWVWALGAAAGLACSARDVWRVVRLKRRTVLLTAQEHARLGLGSSDGTSRREPRLAWCDALDSPAVLGFSSPVIALPHAQVSFLSGTQRRLVVLHELAHIRRRDDWWALAERIILAVTWVNPVVHLMRRELSLSREMACDEWVVRQTAAPAAYARCLADVAVLRADARRLRLAAGVTSRPGALRRRIVSVLALDGKPSRRGVAVAAWVAPVAVCTVAAGLLQVPPVFVVERSRDAAMAATVWSAAAEPSSRVSSDWPTGRPAAGRPADAVRRSASRRSSGPPARPAGQGVPVESTSPAPAPAVHDMAAEQSGAAGTPLLVATSLPGAGAPGVTAAAIIPGAFPSEAGAARWWSGFASVGEATGGAGAAAGRTTASLFSRLGSHVPQLLTR
jgi:hypothetical protein